MAGNVIKYRGEHTVLEFRHGCYPDASQLNRAQSSEPRQPSAVDISTGQPEGGGNGMGSEVRESENGQHDGDTAAGFKHLHHGNARLQTV